MRCPSCSYVFSEELKSCPRCGADVSAELEKLGFFPQPAKEPFLFWEDFKKATYTEEPVREESQANKSQKREVEFNL